MKNSGTRIMQAGAIVFRVLNNRHEVLLILSKKKPQIRIFPKGHIEVGESSEEAALRELIEEAGIRGRSIGIAGGIEQEWDGKLFTITYHIFNFAETVSKGEDGRDPSWFSIAEAYERLSSTELKNLLINTKRQFEIES